MGSPQVSGWPMAEPQEWMWRFKSGMLILVDVCKTGAEPGTIFEVPGEEVETPPLKNVNLHDFRWDHAIAMGRWLLKDRFPRKVTVFLIEAENLSHGFGLSPAVEAATERLVQELLRRFGGTACAT
jgi:hydrogenase maturation protease